MWNRKKKDEDKPKSRKEASEEYMDGFKEGYIAGFMDGKDIHYFLREDEKKEVR